jgi:hypothetical protein
MRFSAISSVIASFDQVLNAIALQHRVQTLGIGFRQH